MAIVNVCLPCVKSTRVCRLWEKTAKPTTLFKFIYFMSSVVKVLCLTPLVCCRWRGFRFFRLAFRKREIETQKINKIKPTENKCVENENRGSLRRAVKKRVWDICGHHRGLKWLKIEIWGRKRAKSSTRKIKNFSTFHSQLCNPKNTLPVSLADLHCASLKFQEQRVDVNQVAMHFVARLSSLVRSQWSNFTVSQTNKFAFLIDITAH